MLDMIKVDNGVSFEGTAFDGRLVDIDIEMSKEFPSLFHLTFDDGIEIYIRSASGVLEFLRHWFPDFNNDIEWVKAYDVLFALKFQS